MPDGDVLSSRVRFAWRPALALMRGGGAPDAVASRVAKALTETLRSRRGIPSLAAYGSILEALAREEISVTAAKHEVRQIAQAQERKPHVLLDFKAVDRCMQAIPRPLAADNAKGLIVSAVCEATMDAELFELARPVLVEQSFAGHYDFDDFVDKCKEELRPTIERIKTSLLEDSSAAALRAAPNRRRNRVSTERLLETSVL